MIIPLDYTTLCSTTTIHHQSDHTTQSDLHYTLLNNHHTSAGWSYHSNYTTLCSTNNHHTSAECDHTTQSDHTTQLHYTLLNNHHTSAGWSYHSTLHYTLLITTTTLCLHQQGDHTTRLHYTLLNNHHTSSECDHTTQGDIHYTLHSGQQPPYIIRVIIPLNYTTLCSTTTIHQQGDHTTRLHYTLLNNHHTSSEWSYHSTTLHSAQQPPYISRVIIPLNYTTLWSTTTIHQQGDHTTRLHYTLVNNHHTSSEWSYHSTTLHSAQQPPYISRVIIPLDYTTLCSTTTIHHQSDHTTQLHYTLLNNTIHQQGDHADHTTRLHYTLLNNHHTSAGWSYHSTTLHSAQQPPYIIRVIIPLDYTTLCFNNHHTSAEWSYHSTTLHSAQQPPYISRVIIPLNYTTLCSTTTIHQQGDHTTQLHYTLLNNHHTSAGWSYHSTTLHSAQQPPYISRVIIPLDYTTLCSTTTIHQQGDHTTQLHYTQQPPLCCLTTTIHHQSDHTTRLHYTLLNNHHTSAGWSYHSTTLHSAQQPPYIIRVIIPLNYYT